MNTSSTSQKPGWITKKAAWFLKNPGWIFKQAAWIQERIRQ
jgi:hypothetical protein